MLGRCLVAIAITCLLSAGALQAQTSPSGVVLQTANARLNSTDAAAGTTVYDGDRIETEAKGVVSLQFGQVQLTLAENSSLRMNHENWLVTPILQRGTVIFRTEKGAGPEVRADDVRVRPHNFGLTVGEVTLDDCNVYVTARTQPLEVTAGRESRILEEGKSFRVARRGACAAAKMPRPPGEFRIWPALVIVGGIPVVPIIKALESPDRP